MAKDKYDQTTDKNLDLNSNTAEKVDTHERLNQVIRETKEKLTKNNKR